MTRTRLIILTFFFFLATVVLLCILIYQRAFHGCIWWECAPKRNFTVLSLNLPKDLFPPNADTYDLHWLRGDTVSVEAASTTNYWKNGVAIFIVRRFATEAKAIRHYEVDSNVKFTNRSGIDSQNDDSIKFEGFYASQSSVQCGYIVNDFRCVFVARYEEFAVFFSSSIDGSEMTKEDFLESITYIDATFEKLIRGSNK